MSTQATTCSSPAGTVFVEHVAELGRRLAAERLRPSAVAPPDMSGWKALQPAGE
jgi:hypothetical protein